MYGVAKDQKAPIADVEALEYMWLVWKELNDPSVHIDEKVFPVTSVFL